METFKKEVHLCVTWLLEVYKQAGDRRKPGPAQCTAGGMGLQGASALLSSLGWLPSTSPSEARVKSPFKGKVQLAKRAWSGREEYTGPFGSVSKSQARTVNLCPSGPQALSQTQLLGWEN